ncbi:MAG: hypothetical protein HYT39_01535 [Candidatus Sungbacteria bacterium]|nr:hypothetical protein [Candidatus Sungbacteria bacterium]
MEMKRDAVRGDEVRLSEFSGPAHVILEGAVVGGERATIEVKAEGGGFLLTLARKLEDGREQKPFMVGVTTTGQLVVVHPGTGFVADRCCPDVWRTNQPTFADAKTA